MHVRVRCTYSDFNAVHVFAEELPMVKGEPELVWCTARRHRETTLQQPLDELLARLSHVASEELSLVFVRGWCKESTEREARIARQLKCVVRGARSEQLRCSLSIRCIRYSFQALRREERQINKRFVARTLHVERPKEHFGSEVIQRLVHRVHAFAAVFHRGSTRAALQRRKCTAACLWIRTATTPRCCRCGVKRAVIHHRRRQRLAASHTRSLGLYRRPERQRDRQREREDKCSLYLMMLGVHYHDADDAAESLSM